VPFVIALALPLWWTGGVFGYRLVERGGRTHATGEDLGLIALDPSRRVIAHIFYWHISRDVPHLGIGIRDEYQNLGLAATLFAYIFALDRHALKKQAVGLTLVKENARALHLYRKFGFRIVGDATFRQPNDSYEMRLDFAPREVAP